MALYTGNWNPLGSNVFYRKLEIYTMGWSHEFALNLAEYVVSASRFGGPIALMRDEAKSKVQTIAGSTGSQVLIFSPAGSLLSTVKLTGKPCLISWSDDEDLVCVKDDGHVTLYDIFGSTKFNFYVDQEIRDTKVLECKLFYTPQKTGLAVITCSHRFFLINNIKEPKIRRLAEVPGMDGPPNSWDVVSLPDKETHIIVSHKTNIYLLGAKDKSCVALNVAFSSSYECINQMSVNFDSSKIAFFTDTGLLWLGKISSELKMYCEFNTKSKIRPQQLLWCGPEAVVGLWKSVLLAVGLENDWFNYVIDGPVHLVEEVDGLRMIGNETHELLQHVPSVVVDIFRIGSISAGTLLLEANKEFERHTHKADDYIKMLRDRNEIELAVSQCIEAAGYEYGVSDQRMLLRAASFGKCFVPETNRDNFVKMCQTLRVLNNVRDYSIAIPLTLNQLEFLSIRVLLDRLVLRRHYPVAMSIAEYLKIPEEEGSLRILGNWASNKVQQMHLDDDEVARDISKKLGYSPSISYSEIANEAIQRGRKQLAIRLLDFEIRASQQVPLLLLLDQHRKALERAIASGDTHLTYTVIYRLKEALSSREFTMIIRNYPVAYSLYQNLCREEDMDKLKEIYYQEDDFNSEGYCWVTESYQNSRIEQRQSCLQAAFESFRKARNDFAATQTEEQMRLLKYQVKLKEKIHLDCIDLSIQETMKRLLVSREYKLAEDLKKDFKVPDKRFWWLKITILANQSEWLELEKFSKNKKSPIGYEPFVEVCMKAKNRYEALKYAPKVKEENKIKYLVKVGGFEEAAKVAVESRDEKGMDFVINKCGPSLRDKFVSMKMNVTWR